MDEGRPSGGVEGTLQGASRDDRGSHSDNTSSESDLLEVEMESPTEVESCYSDDETVSSAREKEGEPAEEPMDVAAKEEQMVPSVESEPAAEEEAAKPYGDIVVEIDGKKFYDAVIVRDEVIKVGDNVDVVYEFTTQDERVTCLGKIAALFQNEQSELKAEVSFYYDSNDAIPGVKQAPDDKKNEVECDTPCHKNEVVASNMFYIIDVDTFDELIEVHGSYEEYLQYLGPVKEEDPSVFCQKIWYSESYAVKPFNVKEGWLKIMLQYSEYHRVYHPEYQEAKETLFISRDDHGQVMIGREKEAAEIKAFLETGIRQGGTGQILYISGVPGTGKSETVSMVARGLLDKKMKGEVPWFDLVEVNGVHLHCPNQFYRDVYSKLMKKKAPPYTMAYEALDKYFSNNKTPCVIIVDEADYIVTLRQRVLFTIFDWPSRPGSKLTVIIISNTMNLSSKMRDSCISRLGCGTMFFQPYNYQQILDVITYKMGRGGRIDQLALELCARRVTNHSGDMRKALQICNHALKQCRGGKVTAADMNRAANSLLNSSVIDALQHTSKVTSCFLVALVLELKETQLSVASAVKVYKAFRGMMAVLWPELENLISIESYKGVLLSVADSGIISLEPTVFTMSDGCRKKVIDPDMNEELGDTGIVPEVDVGQIVTALSRDPYWERKLREL